MEHRGSSILILFLLIFILGNLFLLDLKIFYPDNPLFLSKTIVSIPTSPPTETITPSNLSCPTSCIALINQISTPSSSTNALGGGSLPTLVPTTLPQQLRTTQEIYIPLGNGTTQKSDWDDLTATETIINPSSYGTFMGAYLTYSLRNPTQNGQTTVRLYNVTDKYPIYGTEVTMNGPVSQTINTAQFSLPAGNKVYRVQLRSSLSYPVYLDNAKIRIVTE